MGLQGRLPFSFPLNLLTSFHSYNDKGLPSLLAQRGWGVCSAGSSRMGHGGVSATIPLWTSHQNFKTARSGSLWTPYTSITIFHHHQHIESQDWVGLASPPAIHSSLSIETQVRGGKPSADTPSPELKMESWRGGIYTLWMENTAFHLANLSLLLPSLKSETLLVQNPLMEEGKPETSPEEVMNIPEAKARFISSPYYFCHNSVGDCSNITRPPPNLDSHSQPTCSVTTRMIKLIVHRTRQAIFRG